MRFSLPARTCFVLLPALVFGVATNAVSQQAAAPAAKQMTPADLKAWKTIRQTALTSDGKWLVSRERWAD